MEGKGRKRVISGCRALGVWKNGIFVAMRYVELESFYRKIKNRRTNGGRGENFCCRGKAGKGGGVIGGGDPRG